MRWGDTATAKNARLTRLGLTSAHVGDKLTLDTTKIIKMLARHPPRWPASAQWLQHSDVGSLSQVLQQVLKWVWHRPKEIAAAVELVERIIGGLALARALPSDFEYKGTTLKKIRDKFATLCERGSFVRLIKLINEMARQANTAKQPRRRRTVKEETAF